MESARVRTFFRIRASNDGLDPSEVSACVPVRQQSETSVIVSLNELRTGSPASKGSRVEYEFHSDKCFSPSSSQEEVFVECGVPEMINAAIEGRSSGMIAYGPTGSGKTHTMFGSPGPNEDSHGIVPRAIEAVFARPDVASGQVQVRISCLEIYNEQLYDLIAPENAPKVRGGQPVDGMPFGFAVTGLYEADCPTHAEAYQTVEIAYSSRVVRANAVNARSSRSHILMYLKFRSAKSASKHSSGVKEGFVCFADLAGSERSKYVLRPDHPEALGSRVRGPGNRPCAEDLEAGSINQSIFAFGRFLTEMSKHGSMVKCSNTGLVKSIIRDSALTKVLCEFLGGQSTCSLLACVSSSPSCAPEAARTLRVVSKSVAIRQCTLSNNNGKSRAPRAGAPQLLPPIQQKTFDLNGRGKKVMTRNLSGSFCKSTGPGSLRNTIKDNYQDIYHEQNNELTTSFSNGNKQGKANTRYLRQSNYEEMPDGCDRSLRETSGCRRKTYYSPDNYTRTGDGSSDTRSPLPKQSCNPANPASLTGSQVSDLQKQVEQLLRENQKLKERVNLNRVSPCPSTSSSTKQALPARATDTGAVARSTAASGTQDEPHHDDNGVGSRPLSVCPPLSMRLVPPIPTAAPAVAPTVTVPIRISPTMGTVTPLAINTPLAMASTAACTGAFPSATGTPDISASDMKCHDQIPAAAHFKRAPTPTPTPSTMAREGAAGVSSTRASSKHVPGRPAVAHRETLRDPVLDRQRNVTATSKKYASHGPQMLLRSSSQLTPSTQSSQSKSVHATINQEKPKYVQVPKIQLPLRPVADYSALRNTVVGRMRLNASTFAQKVWNV